jgi:hypothetical protein
MMPELEAIINPRALNTPAFTRASRRRGSGRANSLLAGKIFRRSDGDSHQHIDIVHFLAIFRITGREFFAHRTGNFAHRTGNFAPRAQGISCDIRNLS